MKPIKHELAADLRLEVVSVSRAALLELEQLLGRQIERAETAAKARRPGEAARALKPLIAQLRRLRSGVHQYTHKPIGVVPDADHPAQEVARLFAEIAFCSEHMSKCIDRLSQLDEAKELVSWLRH
jgi:hypothetical protein